MSNSIRSAAHLPDLSTSRAISTASRPPPPPPPDRTSPVGTNGESSFEAAAPEGRGGPGGKPPFLDAAAEALGLTTEELDAKLKSGQSLESIAEEQGVSTEELSAAIAADFKTKCPGATDEEAATVASRVMQGPAAPPEDGEASAQLDDSLRGFRARDRQLTDVRP